MLEDQVRREVNTKGTSLCVLDILFTFLFCPENPQKAKKLNSIEHQSFSPTDPLPSFFTTGNKVLAEQNVIVFCVPDMKCKKDSLSFLS